MRESLEISDSFEKNTADYLYIDENNNVHLLLPVMSGQTIGLDNTCKSGMELKTFFYGCPASDGSSARDSVYTVLANYRRSLEQDIQWLSVGGIDSPALRIKKERLLQIQGYEAILKKIQPTIDIGINQNSEYPRYPRGVDALLSRKTNCLTVQLSPAVEDRFLQMPAPVFSLNRKSYINLTTHDEYFTGGEGLGNSLRTTIENKLNISGGYVPLASPKAAFISEVVGLLSNKGSLSLDELQDFMQELMKDKFKRNISLKENGRGEKINEGYFSAILTEYSSLSPKEAVESILSACLADQFWESVAPPNLFAPVRSNYTNDLKFEAEEANRLSIAVQFFLSQVNIYCYAKGWSKENFGPFFDRPEIRDKMALRISDAIAKHEDVEAVLFNLMNEMAPRLGLYAPHVPLTQEDKEAIHDAFEANFKTIEQSPHFDEFMMFLPEVKGDFFNHKNRISAHFIDFVNASQLSPTLMSEIRQIQDTHHLTANQQALKNGASRQLGPNNPLPKMPSPFRDMLNLAISNDSPSVSSSSEDVFAKEAARTIMVEKTWCKPGESLYQSTAIGKDRTNEIVQSMQKLIDGYQAKILYGAKPTFKQDIINNLEWCVNALMR